MYIGEEVRRREDRRFLTGRGSYVDDIQLPGVVHGAFVRSVHAHALLRSVSVGRASSMPGVLKVLTGEDWEKAGLGGFVVASPVASSDGVDRPQITQPVLTTGKTCYVGQPIAFVVAQTLPQALDAAEAVEVDYEVLPCNTRTMHALDPQVPVLHEELGSNLVFIKEVGDPEAVEAAFAQAAHVTELELLNSRITANPIEPRALLGHYDMGVDRYTLWVSHQAPHILRRDLAENTLLHPEHKIRVISPDVGGGFGMKVANHPEDPLVLWSSRVVGRPVRWTETRSEAQLADSQARDHWTRCRMAFDAQGRILAIEADTYACLGAFQTRLGASIPAQFYSRMIVGLYQIPAAYCRVRGVHTNTPPVQAYRGAGRPEAVYVLESLVENGAREMGIDVQKIRALNLIRKDQFPYEIPLGLTYDSADPHGMLDMANELFNYAGDRARQTRLRDQGVLIGIGGSAFTDCVGTPSRAMLTFGRKKVGGWDSATIRVHPSGKVTVLSGAHSHGQGHATTFAQIAASRLKLPIDAVDVVQGDTDLVQFGHGTWGSRSTVTTGLAIARAADVLVEKCKKIAGHLLECATTDLVHEEGAFVVAGTDRSLSLVDVIDAAYQGGDLPEGMEPGLDQTSFYDPVDRAYSFGLHLCSVQVDMETGRVRVEKYVAVDDCGRIINPMVVEGQAHGGVAQGIGQALMELCVFDDESGQPLSGSFMDYAMPRASDFPMFITGITETPCSTNVLGVRPAGESGTIGALAAVRNAVVDALWHLGVRHVEMPMTPPNVWRAIQQARAAR